ncbi:hypothetical protein EV1_004348 [Malus domestica]
MEFRLQFACRQWLSYCPPSLVFTEALKFQNPLPNGCSRTPWCMLAKPSSSQTSMGGHGDGGRRRRGLGKLRVATDGSPSTDIVADDYYAVLGLLPDATEYGQPTPLGVVDQYKAFISRLDPQHAGKPGRR